MQARWPKTPQRRRYFIDFRLSRQFVAASVLLSLLAASLVFLFLSIDRRTSNIGGLSVRGFAALVLAFGILTLTILQRLYRSIARPIEELSVQMQRLNDGDFSARVPVRSLNEIGSLQANFNRAAERIEAMIEELRKLDQMKSDFISTVSHELRTPLTSIGGYVKLIGSGDAGPVTDTQQEFLSIIDTNVERLTLLINDILDMEKMESGKFQLLKEPQDLREILRECQESLLLMANQKGLELRIKLPRTLPLVIGERQRLVQIFSNLVSNAIKYSNSGSVEVEVETREFALLIRVRDTGIGISPEDQERLFEKFFRTDAGLASREKGTGLGLAITRGLVEAHGGTISLESSEPGKGSVFLVTLPVISPVFSAEEVAREKTGELVRALERVKTARESEQMGAPESLWIIDPDQRDAEIVRKLVETGNSVFPGRSFITRSFPSMNDVPEPRMGEPAPAIIIVDPVLVSGEVQSLSDLRRKLKFPVPVLVISDSVDSGEVFADGGSALITKPIVEREFWIALQDLLRNRGLRVLLADANTDFRILMKRELEQRGFEVDDVDRGKLVMGRLDHDRYDLLLLDLGFPDVSGLELLKSIRKRRQFDPIPVYVMYDDDVKPPSPEEMQPHGKNVFIGKEHGIEGITDRISEELETSHEAHPIG